MLGAAYRDDRFRMFFQQDGGVEHAVLLGPGQFFTVQQQNGLVPFVDDFQFRNVTALGDFRDGQKIVPHRFLHGPIVHHRTISVHDRKDGDVFVNLNFPEFQRFQLFFHDLFHGNTSSWALTLAVRIW